MPVVAYNRLSDLVATFTLGSFATASISATSGAGATLNFDSIEITKSLETTNNKGGQDLMAINRPTGADWSVKVTGAYGSGVPVPREGYRGKLAVTGGGNEVCDGIVTDVSANYNDNSKYDFTIKAYGLPIGSGS